MKMSARDRRPRRSVGRKAFMAMAVASTMAAAPAWAGNILLTGHDTDDHLATSFMNWALTFLTTGNGSSVPANPSAKIGYIGNTSPNLDTYLGNYNNFQFYDLDTPSWPSAFTDGNAVLVVGSGSDFVSSAGSAALNAQQPAFVSYFNGGGSLFVNTHQGLGQGFYNFVPPIGNANASNLTTCSVETGNGQCMRPTPQGASVGHTLAQIVAADITHNQWSNFNPFVPLSLYVPTGNAITIALLNSTAGPGGFTPGSGIGAGGGAGSGVPEPAPLALLGAGLAGLGLMRLRRRGTA